MPKMNIRKDDLVEVISGKDKGKRGKVLRALPFEGKVVVEGVAIVKKAVRPNPNNQSGGIVSQEAAIDVSTVMLVCPKCDAPVRVSREQGELDGNRRLIRVCKKCGERF